MKAEQSGKREAGGWLVPSPESQRRSGDLTGSRAAVEIYGWQVSDKPFSIKIPLDIVDRLQRDIQYGLGMTTSCDVMGLLIGRIATEYSSTLIIQDYVLTGYTSDSDSPERWSDERLAEMGRPFTRLASPFFVVGFFRSQRGDWPEVEKEDFKGAKRLLRSTPNVFLLIRTGFSRGFSGRLFLRPSRRAKFKDEYGEFPLNADILRAQCEATAPKREQPPLHFVPGNPLQGRPPADLAVPASVEASFACVTPPEGAEPPVPLAQPAETPSITLTERLRAKFLKLFPPAMEQGLRIDPAPASDLPMEPPKQGLWAKMFPAASEHEEPRLESRSLFAKPSPPVAEEIEPIAPPDRWAKPSRPADEEKAPLIQPAAAAASVESPSLSVEPSLPATEEKAPLIQPAAVAASVESPSLSVEPSLPATDEKAPLVDPVAAASAESPSLFAKPSRPVAEDKSPLLQPAAAASSEPSAAASVWAKPSRPGAEEKVPLIDSTAANAEPSASPSRWTKLFRPAVEDKASLIEPAAAASAESIASPSRWTKLFRPAVEEKAPVVEPVAAASAESPSLFAKPSRPVAEEKASLIEPAVTSARSIASPSWWAKLFRPAAEESPIVEPVAAASAESPSLFAKPSRPVAEEKASLIDPAVTSAQSIASPSWWAKLFRPADAEESPIVEPVAAASAESPSLFVKPSRPIAEEKASPIEPAAAASAESFPSPSRWGKLFRPADAEESPVAAASAESPSLFAKPSRPVAEEKASLIEPAVTSARSIASPSWWAKLFRPAVEEKAPVVEPVAAASAESFPSPTRWAKLFRPADAEESPVAAASAESPSLFAKPSRPVAEEKASLIEPAAAASSESFASPSRWAKLFRPADAEESPVVEPVAAASAESIAQDISPEPPKPSLWARAAASSAESIASPSRWTKLFRPAAKEEAPVVQPIAAASAESIASDISPEPPKPSLWATFRAPNGVAFATKTPLSTLPWNRWLSIAATWIIAAGATMWFMHGRSSLRVQRPEVSETRSSILSNLIGLHVDNSGRLLNISWDRASSIAMNSKAGFLTIRDGSLLSEVRLDSTEVRTGHIYYRPRSEDLGIRLEVTGDDGGMASESVRVLGPLASARPASNR